MSHRPFDPLVSTLVKKSVGPTRPVLSFPRSLELRGNEVPKGTEPGDRLRVTIVVQVKSLRDDGTAEVMIDKVDEESNQPIEPRVIIPSP